MCEYCKTGVFLVIAAVAVLIAWASRPSLPVVAPEDMRGKPLFPQFTDALAATSLEITKYDEKTATVQPFRVAQVGGLWSIPSHDNYPADAKDQLASVAADMVGLKVLDVASENPGDHGLFGVLAPDLKTLKPGDTGVGVQVTMRDKDNQELMSLVIGGQVPDRPELHYVRRPGQDPVYTVAIQTSKLSTKFQDWIENDLLKLNVLDLEDIQMQDYSVDELNGRIIQRGKMKLDYSDAGELKWKLVQDEQFQEAGGTWAQRKLGADQELDTAKLDEMKTALDDLKIVDVARKPAGLSADLKAEKSFLNDPQARESLDNLGFYAAQVGDHFGIYSNEGEIRCLMKDGVEYVLRFGQIATGTGSVDDDKDDKKPANKKKGGADKKAKHDEKGKEAEEGGSGLNRYIFVMAEFNPAAIAKPEYQPLSPAQPAAAEKKAEPPKPGAAAKKGDEKAEKAKADELAKQRVQIQQENQRKKDEYEDAVKKGQARVKELNGRFADWYYVIPDSVYRKIHLARDQIVKKKEAKKDGGKQAGEKEGGMTPVDFDRLKGGLQTPEK